MSQQLAIIVLVDVAAALAARSLAGHTYLFDNMRRQGSEGEGTGDLVTAVGGAHWIDGSQADEKVLNWLPYSLGSIPPTVPRSFHADRGRASDEEALAALSRLAGSGHDTDLSQALAHIRRRLGTRARVASARRTGHVGTAPKVIDLAGEVVYRESDGAIPTLANPTPRLTAITGQAVDEGIIYPALYGSPDLLTDGWYWSATVDTSRPGTYAYTMQIHLHDLVWRGGWVWEPVRMEHDARIRVTKGLKRNGFTGAGTGLLPVA